MSEVVGRHGGIVEKYIGDAVMAVFGVPVLHEDDALRASGPHSRCVRYLTLSTTSSSVPGASGSPPGSA